MMDFLIKHKLINTSQHGFLKARSCLTNWLCFFEEITKWVDEGLPVDVIYLGCSLILVSNLSASLDIALMLFKNIINAEWKTMHSKWYIDDLSRSSN